ncbi:MAG: fumarylacetoacetate hydrolase family protein [Actinomycetota bacterium]|nr:fumarylacetoacetate hydrolase family protein [Actinomycetota bacterium]
MPLVVRFSEPPSQQPSYGVVEDGKVAIIEPHPFTLHRPTGRALPLDDVRLLAPVIPSKIVCVGRNYPDHARELGGEVGDEPLIFLKPSTAVIGPYDPIRYPAQLTNELHYEGELAVVIGRLTHQTPPEQARDAIFGFTCGNDVTARDLQRKDGQWTRAKGFDTFCPLGPAIATDLDPGRARVRTYLDGELRQDGSTADMVFDVDAIVSHVSQVMTLLPGDVVLSGTPAGVGPIEPGQTVRVEIEGIGVLENPVSMR